MTTKTSPRHDADTGQATSASPALDVSSLLESIPGDLDHAGEAVAGAIRTLGTSVSGAPDGSLLVGTSLAAGVAIGLLVGGGPRLFAAAAMTAALTLGASLAQRHATLERPAR